MGVNGLWTVVQPCARPTNLATLNRKRLAVDASIWIYQFLKAVRDKEGNALRNSHVVGFFRRICKLLWFGIQPVFVFDGGAPALKRATIQGRKKRREGRRDDAVRTAGKLLAVQMQRAAAEENDRRKRDEDRGIVEREEEMKEVIPENVTYVAEIGMSQNEKQQTRRFHKKDAYHLPELDGGIAAMGKPDDPRIMSVEELEEYARQFHNGEDINLYDFSKIDFDGDFFKSLPAPDRYNILNAARLRSRLRMGLSKEQLDGMFPDRMAFSRFQIERVRERNHLTQRLMAEVGMTGTDLTLGVNGRVAGEKDREYILVKNEGVEGGWALGVVSKEKDIGEEHKPIDVDAIEIQYQGKEDPDESDDGDFEDVPIEGLNRLPKLTEHMRQRQSNVVMDVDEEGSLFVGGEDAEADVLFDDNNPPATHPEEEDDINRAIAMSLRTQHGVGQETEDDDDLEDVPMTEPEWTQKQVEPSKPITASSGSMIAHIVNNRASAAVPKRKVLDNGESDSDDDMQAVLARSRKVKKPQPANRRNPFDGPLPFPKLDLGSSLFGKKPESQPKKTEDKGSANGDYLADGPEVTEVVQNGTGEDDDLAGGFEREQQAGPKDLPPWLADETDIRESLKKQQDAEREINAADREDAEEKQRLRRREMRHEIVQVDSSDDESDIEVNDAPPAKKESQQWSSPARQGAETSTEPSDKPKEGLDRGLPHSPRVVAAEISEDQTQDAHAHAEKSKHEQGPDNTASVESPEPEFEDVPTSEPQLPAPEKARNPSPIFEEVPEPAASATAEQEAAKQLDDELFADVEYDEFSDPGDEELMIQMAEEAEEHARFASELNNKSAEQNREDYEKELRGLRNQQKKDRRDADEVTQVMVTECQALLRLFGIPYITAPMEAEAQCAELVKLGLVDGIVTDDSDTFLFGGTRVYKNMFNSNKFVECYLGQDLETELSLSREQLISIAQLLGSDYTEGLPGVGPVTAVEILSEFPGRRGLEQFRDWWKSVQGTTHPSDTDLSTPFRRKFRKSQGTKLFLPAGFPSPAVYDAYLQPEVDNSAESFQWGVPDLEGLRRFLMATIGWGQERTDEVLLPVIKDMNKRDREGTQSNITRFFGGGVGVGAKEAFAPRQRGQGSKRMAAAVDRLRANVTGVPTEEEVPAPKKRRTKRAKRKGPEDDNEAE